MERLNIAVFAHNEQINIIRCLHSICNSTSDRDRLNVKVLVNGSSDATSELVSDFCEKNKGFALIDIKLADKANAWNEYIYSEPVDGEPHYFMDGDNWLPALCLDYISKCWDYRTSTAVAALPIGVSESLRNMLRDNAWISGNFYGLSPGFIDDIRSRNFRIPVGFIGEDSLITYFLETGMENDDTSLSVEKRKKLITVLDSTGPVIPKVSLSINSFRMLHNRYKRYALRHFQQEIFYYLCRTHQIQKLPEHANDLKYFLKEIGMKPYLSTAGIQTAYHPYAIIKMLLSKNKVAVDR